MRRMIYSGVAAVLVSACGPIQQGAALRQQRQEAIDLVANEPQFARLRFNDVCFTDHPALQGGQRWVSAMQAGAAIVVNNVECADSAFVTMTAYRGGAVTPVAISLAPDRKTLVSNGTLRYRARRLSLF